jgi:uncharacterized protein (DUF2267 family)
MANEIVKLVAKKAKISESVAQVAVDVVLSALKTKLPPSMGSTLDSFLGSGSATASKKAVKSDSPLGDIGDIAGKLGGLLGKK